VDRSRTHIDLNHRRWSSELEAVAEITDKHRSADSGRTGMGALVLEVRRGAEDQLRAEKRRGTTGEWLAMRSCGKIQRSTPVARKRERGGRRRGSGHARAHRDVDGEVEEAGEGSR
jgi:hypothetical protein